MSETLCTLRGTGSGGGRYKETSLWTNSAPTSNFADQNVTLSDSITNYKYIAIRIRFSTTESASATTIVSTSDFVTMTNTTTSGHPLCFVGGRYSNVYERAVYYVDATTVKFGSSFQQNSTSVSNGTVIPTEILGLNELAHGTMYTSNADVQQFKSVSANAIPTFTTKGKAVAIYITRYVNSNTKAVVYTNVNPTTGAINNSEIYVSDTDSMPWAIWSQGTFIVTDNQITTNKAFSTAAHKLAIMYTY